MNKTLLTESEVESLNQALHTARRARRDHALALEQCAKTGGNGMFTVEAANQLAQVHRAAEAELYQLSLKLDRTVNVVLEIEE